MQGTDILVSCKEADLVLKKRVEVANCQLDCGWGWGWESGDRCSQRQEIHADDRERVKTHFRLVKRKASQT